MSTGGGIYPRWRRDGQELFFATLENRMMAAPIQVGSASGTIAPGPPVVLFPMRLAIGANVGIGGYMSRAQYDVASDGRFLLNVTTEDTGAAPITLVVNWPALLKR